ncbi:MAG: FixH family protein [Niastella sp.]|nr:FixH family protein [Niastella sp.]
MKKSFNVMLSLASFIILFFTSCSKNEIPESSPTDGLTKITEGYAPGAAAKVEVYTSVSVINTGYTNLYLAIYDSLSGNRVDNANIQLTPMMDMGSMQHSSPFENPASVNAVNHLFPCSVVFIMPSTAGNWTVSVTVLVNGKLGTFSFPVTVVDPVKSTLKSFTALNNGAKYFVALINPVKPHIGINDMEIAIYKKESMMSYPAENGFTILMEPEMPTMGHGSPNNVNPIGIGNGHYKGKVNFTMTGLWQVNLEFMMGSEVADDTQFFEIEF